MKALMAKAGAWRPTAFVYCRALARLTQTPQPYVQEHTCSGRRPGVGRSVGRRIAQKILNPPPCAATVVELNEGVQLGLQQARVNNASTTTGCVLEPNG